MATTDTKVLFARGAFDINHQLSDGLYVRVEGGILLNGLGYHGIQGAHLLLTASVANYVECSAVGVVSANVTGFTPGAVPLYEIKMGATTITSCNDWRNADVALGGAAVAVRSEAAALAVNDLVYVSGWNETYGLPLVTKADADVSGAQAQFVMRAALAQNANGMAFTAFRTAANLNTLAAGAVGDPVYLDATTAGGWTLTPPATATGIVQIVGHVAVDSLTVGVIEFDLRDFPTVGTNDIQGDAITSAKIADDQIDSEHYAPDSIDAEHYAPGSVDTTALGADAVTAPKITAAALAISGGVAAVAVAHDAASPFEILAADALNDRIALVEVNATEAAADGPDIDIGTTNTINAVVDDLGAGAWAVGDRMRQVIRIPAGENVRATITAAGTAGVLDVYVHVLTPVAQTANIATGAVTAPKVTDAALGIVTAATIVLDHADASPAELLAADATQSRIVTVFGTATEAAAGDPDIDIGSVSVADGIINDVAAGAWGVGYRFTGSINLPAGEALRATIAAAGTAGAFNLFIHAVTPAPTRANLIEDPLAVYGIPAHDLKSNAGAALLAAETADTFNIAVAANVISVQGEITDIETETSVGYFQFVLPPEYVPAGDVTIRLKTALIKTGAAVNNASSIDVEVYEQTGNGAVGADLCTTAASGWVADDTWYTKDFAVTAAGLVAGDILNVKITTVVVDSEAGAGTLRANLDGIAVLLDVRG